MVFYDEDYCLLYGIFFFFFLIGLWLRKRKKRIEFARVSFKALIPCRKPKSNENGKYNGEIEREGENGG